MSCCSALKHGGVPVRRAFVAIVCLTALSSVFLFMLERKYSRATAKLDPLARALVPSSCTPDPNNDGLYVHLDCPVKAASTFSPPFQFAKNVSPFHGAWFEVRAEMFQPVPEGFLRSWSRALLGGGDPTRRMAWADHLLSERETLGNARSALYFPAVPGLGRQVGFAETKPLAALTRRQGDFREALAFCGRVFQVASSISIGDFALPSKTVGGFRQSAKLELTDDGVYAPQPQSPPKTLDSQSTRLYDGCLYTGSPWNPRGGDMRVCFFGSKATHASVIGLQQKRPLSGVREIADGEENFDSGKPFLLFAEGDWSPSELLAKHVEELGYPKWFVWSWRATAFLLYVAVFASVAAFAEEEEAPWLLRWMSKGQPCCFVLLKCLCLAAAVCVWIGAAAMAPVKVASSKRLLVLAGGLVLAALILRFIGYRVSAKRKPTVSEAPPAEASGDASSCGVLCAFPSISLPSAYEGTCGNNVPLLSSCASGSCLEKKETCVGPPSGENPQILRWMTAPAIRSFQSSSSQSPEASTRTPPPALSRSGSLTNGPKI